MNNFKLTILFLCSIIFASCLMTNKKSLEPPSWSKALTIYEIMPKNYHPGQKLNNITTELHLIRTLFVSSIALASITPCDVMNSSYNPNDPYASIDFESIDTSLGTKNDLTNLIEQAHQNQLKFLLEFDISYTGPNHPWRKSNPDFYQSNNEKVNELYNPKYIQLNYNNKKLRSKIIKILKKWKSNYKIDGIILLNTDALPKDFCEEISNEIKSQDFLLASGSDCPEQVKNNTFDSYFNSKLYKILKNISNNQTKSSDFKEIFQENVNSSQKGMSINFTRNARINQLDPSENNLFPYYFKLPALISVTCGGIPLILNGQEEPMFQKIDVAKPTFMTREYQYNLDFYRSLFIHRKENGALYSLENNLPEFISDSEEVLAYERKIGNASVVLMANLTDKEVTYSINRSYTNYTEFFTRALVVFAAGQEYKLGPHQFLFLSNKK